VNAPPLVPAPAPDWLLFQDESLIVVNKPSGMLVHRGWGTDRVTALSALRDQLGAYVYPVHRLDRATSGALLFTLSSELAASVQASFERGEVTKNYLVVTRGITPNEGLVDHAIAKSKAHDKRPAFTAFRRLGQFERYSLVQARPYTGRLHQIRRHMKFISHPVIGDTRYGKGEHNRLFRERFALHRMALHASCLSFVHPLTGELLVAHAPVHADLRGPLSQMGLGEVLSSVEQEPPWQPDREALPRFADPE
jgi:tRNA pseudouridine65 synthase